MKDKRYSIKNPNRFLTFMDIAYDDYISSRILFGEFKLLQASFLANTAIEKVFKSIMIMRGLNPPRTHILEKLHPHVVSAIPKLRHTIDLGYLGQLSKIYKCRYVSDLPVDFNIVIIRRKYLAELDQIFSAIDKSFTLHKNGEPIRSKYRSLVENKSIHLFRENHIMLNIDKSAYIEQLDSILELRIMPNGEVMQVFYPTADSKNDQNFAFVGLGSKKEEGHNSSVELSHKVIENPVVDTVDGKKFMQGIKK